MKIENIIDIWLPRFLLCVSISLMISSKGWGQPTATISGGATVCQDAAPPNITFTGANGPAPYTFTYTINSGTDQSVTTTSGNSVTVPVPTITAGTFTYTLISVSDATFLNQTASGFVVVAVSPLPVPTITGTAVACLNSTGNIYSTETGMSSYSWSVTGGAITAGSATNTITVIWNTAGPQTVSVNYTNVNLCTAPTPTVKNITVNPLPVLTITGNASACLNSAGNSYVTEAGMTGYTWAVTGGTITSGSATNSIMVTWNAAGAQTVSVNYTDGNSCTAATPTVKNVTVNTLPVPTITGNATACVNSTGNIYTTETGMSSYSWSVTGGTITAGIGTNTITVTWNTSGAQSVSINYNNANNCPAASATVHTVTVDPSPVPTITGPVAVCINSTGNIYTTETGMSSYSWSVTGGTITAGIGTNAITVTWNIFGAQSVSVNYNNANNCTAILPTVHAVTVDPLPVPTLTSSDADNNGSCGNMY